MRLSEISKWLDYAVRCGWERSDVFDGIELCRMYDAGIWCITLCVLSDGARLLGMECDVCVGRTRTEVPFHFTFDLDVESGVMPSLGALEMKGRAFLRMINEEFPL